MPIFLFCYQTLKQACPEEILKQVKDDTFRVQGDKVGSG